MFRLEKQYMPRKALQALYYSLIHTHLLYGLPVWGSTHPSYLKKLILLQNNAVKLIGGGLYNDRASPFYSQLKILRLPYLYKLEIGKFVNAHFQNRFRLNVSYYFVGNLKFKILLQSSSKKNLKIIYFKFKMNKLSNDF